ncbi:hypothetical protein AB0H77_09125 [Streptomyces sp. NPDC050844]|uniref:hypothetical protein n=1 Tax=Streptomyces sp. NPDC050844 TaxID=3155790 RepID=UPI0033EFCEB2
MLPQALHPGPRHPPAAHRPGPGPVDATKCCKQRTITLPPEAGAKLWQPLQYGTAEWQRVYFRLRNAIEGMNGFTWTPKGYVITA